MSTEESPKLALHRLPLYNPSRLKDAEIIAAFVTREPLMRRIVADIAAEKPRSRAQHHLIVGQRGMGKTLLLARIAAELRTSSLKERFIPLVFAEEQYAIDRLSKFWLNCLDSLADEHDRTGNTVAVDEIDNTVRRLTSRLSGTSGDHEVAREALDAFLKAATTTGKRPVLLVDNLQIVFERISPDEQHMLREALMRPGCPVLVGASPIQPAATERYDAAFYDQFKTHYLRPLSEEEMQALMLHLAQAVERPEVRDRVIQHPERVKVLRQLTGGSPRTTATLFFLYAEDFAPDVFGDLENLLDRVTPLYKAVFEDLPAQQQVLGSAIANHWDPITARQLADITGLAPGKVSPQLDRMEKSGFIEKVELFDNTSTGYQIAERFFNVWFLMRSASRRQRREVEFLTRFLQTIYEAPERDRLARHLMSECNLSADRYLLTRAVAASLEQDSTREDLLRFADMDVLRQRDRKARRELNEILDLSALPTATLEFDALRNKLKSLMPQHPPVIPDEFADKVLGDRQMFRDGQRERLATRMTPFTAEEIEKTLSVIDLSQKLDIEQFSVDSVKWFVDRLASGQLRSAHDAEDWNRAFITAETSESIELMLRSLPDDFGSNISPRAYEAIECYCKPGPTGSTRDWRIWAYDLDRFLQRHSDAEFAYSEAIKRDANDSTTWFDLGTLLLAHTLRHEEAEIAFRKAIELNPKFSIAWYNLGNLLNNQLHRHTEAEGAFREAIVHDPNDASAWFVLGNLLQSHLQRFDEAEEAYRKAISINPTDAGPWFNLGNLLQTHLQRYDEAEAAYREAIDKEPEDFAPWNNLGTVLQNHLRRDKEAEEAYREAIARDPNAATPWFNLGYLLSNSLQRFDEAEDAYRRAIERDPQDSSHWNNLGLLLYNHLHRHGEAEEAYREAIKRDPKNGMRWINLGELLENDRQRYDEAASAYREAIELDDKNVGLWNRLANLLCDHLHRFREAGDAYNKAVEIDPNSETSLNNLIFLHRDFLGEGAAARSRLENLKLRPALEYDDSMHLHEGLFCAYESNWGLAASALAKALVTIGNGFPSSTVDDWMRTGAVLLHLDLGELLLKFLDDQGADVRLRPWYEALKALDQGDRRYLQNIAPEIRGAAEQFYDQMESRLNNLPDSTRRRPLPSKPKRAKRGKAK